MRTRLGILLAAWVVLVPSTLPAGSRSQDLKVLRSTEQSIQIEFTPQYYQARTVKFKSKEFLDYDFDGSAQTGMPKEIGVPDLRYKILPLGFPAKDGNSVQIIAADYEDIPNVLLKPTPTLQVKDEMLVLKDYVINAEAYNQNKFMPGKVAELSSVEQNRSMLIGSVRVYPIQYNPATRTLRRYSRIVVEVVFGTSPAQRVQNADNQLFEGVLLNYEAAKLWKFGVSGQLNRTTGAPSVLNTGRWYRLAVADEGMYLLDAQYLSQAGINLAGIDPRTIKIYGNGGKELSENVTAPRPVDLVENAIHVEGESDGQFNSGDYILFFGKGVQGISYDPLGKTLRHYIHHYSRVNYYWITFGGANGKRMAQQPTPSAAPTVVPSKFTDAVFVEPDTVNIVRSGKDWVSQPIEVNGSVTRTFPLHGLIAGEPRVYRYTLVASSQTFPTFTVTENGGVIGAHTLQQSGGQIFATSGTFEVNGVFPVSNNTSQLRFQFASNSTGAAGYIDWIEIVYPRTFDPVNNFLRFRSPDTSGIVEYRLGQFTGAASIYNVTDPANVQKVSATSGVFKASEQGGQVSEYCALGSSAYKQPTAVVNIANQNLRGISERFDFIIITSSEFKNAANRLKDYRRQPAHGGLKTIVVTVDEIYNEFSSGVPDVSAIRDFLKYSYESWAPLTPPEFVLMLGAASYDYKGIFGAKSSFVPTWQTTENPFDDINSSATDDFFGRISTSRSPWFSMGRLNARTVNEANFLVERIIAYEENSARDAWKTRIIYVGDDGYTPDASRGEEGTLHTGQIESIAENYTPGIFEKKKIYLEEYPTVQTAQGRRKPGAYQDIIDEINRGALIVNYTGHGNPTVWAHESVFSVSTSIPLLVNANKLSVFFAATCNFSQYDDPRRYTGAELLMNKEGGGAIAVVSASRKVYADQNFELHRGIYSNMFALDQFGRTLVKRVSTAIYLYKSGFNDSNDEKFLLLGDPTMHLQFPRGYAYIDSINSQPVDTVNGIPRSNAIQLQSLARVTIKGTIRDASNQLDANASGRLTLLVNDATRRITIPTFFGGPFAYLTSGAIIYRGENSVSNGKFTARFVVPKDIAYADSTTRGRIVSYFINANSSNDGVGYTTKVAISGSDPNAPVDTEGPSIKITLGNSYESGSSFRPGDVVNEKPMLFVDLVDSNGINTSTSGVGHRIEAWINNSSRSNDLTEFYTSRLDNFQAGTVQYPLRDLPQGRNTIKVRAWDTYNNARDAETYFEVMSSDQLRVVDVINYPNPFAKGTAFTFRHNQPVPVNATVKVYTIAGRLIKTLENPLASDSFVSIQWDGRDRDGDVLANGVYLYKIVVRTVDGRFSSEVLGKLAIAK